MTTILKTGRLLFLIVILVLLAGFAGGPTNPAVLQGVDQPNETVGEAEEATESVEKNGLVLETTRYQKDLQPGTPSSFNPAATSQVRPVSSEQPVDEAQFGPGTLFGELDGDAPSNASSETLPAPALPYASEQFRVGVAADGKLLRNVPLSPETPRFFPLPAPRAALTAEEQEAMTDEDDEERYRFAVPANGDLNGDGLDDVLVITSIYGQEGIRASRIEAHTGNDGTLLWSFTTGLGVYWGGYLPGDVTGDGRVDLSLITYENEQVHYRFPPPGTSCIECTKTVVTATTRLVTVSGATGATAWEHGRDVTFVYNEQLVPWILAVPRTYIMQNLFNAFTPMGDMDGDGGIDVMWAPWEVAYTDVKNEQVAHVNAYAGETGATLWSRDLVGGGAVYYNHREEVLAGAWPGPDANGNGTPDLYTSEIQETQAVTTLTRKALEGRTGEVLWQRSDAWASDARPLSGAYVPLEGDGASIIWTLVGAEAWTTDVEALNPATGATRWKRAGADAILARPAGRVSGDVEEDVLLLGVNEGLRTTLTTVDGVTGEQLTRRILPARSGETDWDWMFLTGPIQDHDGDGARDALVGRGYRVYDATRKVYVAHDAWSMTSLADGAELWNFTRDDSTATTILYPAPSFTPGERPDVFGGRVVRYGETNPSVDLWSLKGDTGRVLWNGEDYREGDANSIWVASVGFMRDADGRHNGDVLVSTSDVVGRVYGEEPDLRVEILPGRLGDTVPPTVIVAR